MIPHFMKIVLLVVLLFFKGTAAPCKAEEVFSIASDRTVYSDLDEMACLFSNLDVKNALGGDPETCDVGQLLFQRGTGPAECPAIFRNKFIGFIRTQATRTAVDENIAAHPIFVLGACSLTGAYNQAYVHQGSCAVVDTVTPRAPKFKGTTTGIVMCRTLRVRAIKKCMDSSSSIDLCAAKFHLMIEMTQISRATNGIKDNARSLLLPELMLAFKLESPSTLIPSMDADVTDDATDPNPGDNTCVSTSIVFNVNSLTSQVVSNLKKLYGGAGGSGSYLNAEQKTKALEIAGTSTSRGTSLPVNRVNLYKKFHSFLVAACKDEMDCLDRYLKTTAVRNKWPDLIHSVGKLVVFFT